MHLGKMPPMVRLDHKLQGVEKVLDFVPNQYEVTSFKNQMGGPTMRALVIGVVSALALSGAAFAQQQQLGTADQAKTMLLKAVAAVKADELVALEMFNKGDGGFREGDLYPFCFRISDGKTVASPRAVLSGTDVRTLKDSTGKMYGPDLYAAGQKPEGQLTEVSYMFPKPGTMAPPFQKVSFVTRANNEIACGVGYYK
jgi:Single Cache domain 2